jgi:hypothetical protein
VPDSESDEITDLRKSYVVIVTELAAWKPEGNITKPALITKVK